MASQTVKEMFGQLVANYSHMTGNYDLLREAEIFLSVIPAMLDEKGILGILQHSPTWKPGMTRQ